MKKTSLLPDTLTPENWPTRDEIMRLAYHLYLEKGCPDGREVEEWLKAEKMLLDRAMERSKTASLTTLSRTRSDSPLPKSWTLTRLRY